MKVKRGQKKNNLKSPVELFQLTTPPIDGIHGNTPWSQLLSLSHGHVWTTRRWFTCHRSSLAVGEAPYPWYPKIRTRIISVGMWTTSHFWVDINPLSSFWDANYRFLIMLWLLYSWNIVGIPILFDLIPSYSLPTIDHIINLLNHYIWCLAHQNFMSCWSHY